MSEITALMQDDLIILVLPLFLLTVAIESAYSAWRKLEWYQWQDFWGSMGIMLITPLVDLLPKLLAVVAMFAVYEISPLQGTFGRQWWAWVLLFLLDDFIYYCFHRANHEIRFMWAGHVNHHSSQYMNYGTALRQGVGERVYKYFFWLPLPLLGFEPAMVITMMSISLFYQFWIHTRAIGKLHPLIEFIFNTPSHHRVHHASNIRYLDCNHGGTLIIWDRLCGTFSEELEQRPRGVRTDAQYRNLQPVCGSSRMNTVANAARMSVALTQWRDKLRYLLLAPGWRHNGPDERARILRAQAGLN